MFQLAATRPNSVGPEGPPTTERLSQHSGPPAQRIPSTAGPQPGTPLPPQPSPRRGHTER
ncbi:DUF6053 domain-containing protein [Lysobacter enzymogenes]|uniref:DUF6053 domain-containing protein n=1 Tax=Lysobacter enzymogenes TaxID=69 RepID=UPI003D18C63D